MTTIDMTEYAPMVEAIANDLGRKYARYGADRDDMSQTCWLWLHQHPRKVTQYLTENDPKIGIKMLARALRNECADYGEDCKAQDLGYSRQDLYNYARAELEALLDSVYDEEKWHEPPVSEDGGRAARRDPATGGGWIATLADVSQALDRISQEDRLLLEAFHRDGWSNKDLAQHYGVSESAMTQRHQSAVRRLHDVLGGPKVRGSHDADCDHMWIGRRSISNAAARAQQSSYYENEG